MNAIFANSAAVRTAGALGTDLSPARSYWVEVVALDANSWAVAGSANTAAGISHFFRP